MGRGGAGRAAAGVFFWGWVSSLAGCAGSATLRLVSLQPREIDPPSAGVFEIEASECAWWRDATGELHLGMRSAWREWMVGRLVRTESIWHLRLGEPPAGRARNYSMGAGQVRGVIRSALSSQSYSSSAGIVSAIVDKRARSMRGSFRIWTMQYPEQTFFSVMPQTAQPVLMLGTYQAREDGELGRSIVEGLGIAERATSQATSRRTTNPGGS